MHCGVGIQRARSRRRSSQAARRFLGSRISSAALKVGSAGSTSERARDRGVHPVTARAPARGGLRQQRARGEQSHQQQPARRGQRDEAVQERQADGDLRLAGRPVAWRAPRDQRGHQELAALQADRGEHPVEIVARRAGERRAGAVLVRAGRIADQQQRGRGIALGEYQVAGGVAQRAAVEGGDGGAEVFQGGRCRGGLRARVRLGGPWVAGRVAPPPPAPLPQGEGEAWHRLLPLPLREGGGGRGTPPAADRPAHPPAPRPHPTRSAAAARRDRPSAGATPPPRRGRSRSARRTSPRGGTASTHRAASRSPAPAGRSP